MQRFTTDIPLKGKAGACQPRRELERKPDEIKRRLDVEPTLSEKGLPLGQQYASLRGDPSLQETALTRNKYVSRIDKKMDRIQDVCEHLLTQTDCYSIYIGFNSSEVRTESILNPFGYDIHDVDALTLEGYLERHFVQVPFDAKMNAIDWVQRRIEEGPIGRFRSGSDKSKMPQPQPRSWTLVGADDVCGIVRDLVRLREVDDYYLRNAAISLAQGIVRASFNCDGTYVIPVRHFRDFVARNFQAAG